MSNEPHLEAQLQRNIDVIRDKVRKMAELTESALNDGLRALFENDGQLAYSIILRDQQIDEYEKEIDRLCLEFMVRQQPAAGLLRFVYATIKINQELERIGDYAESVARQGLLINSLDVDIDYSKFKAISEISIPMLGNAVDAFSIKTPTWPSPPWQWKKKPIACATRSTSICFSYGLTGKSQWRH